MERTSTSHGGGAGGGGLGGALGGEQMVSHTTSALSFVLAAFHLPVDNQSVQNAIAAEQA